MFSSTRSSLFGQDRISCCFCCCIEGPQSLSTKTTPVNNDDHRWCIHNFHYLGKHGHFTQPRKQTLCRDKTTSPVSLFPPPTLPFCRSLLFLVCWKNKQREEEEEGRHMQGERKHEQGQAMTTKKRGYNNIPAWNGSFLLGK